jgi:uncharacterized protein YndB with AHSA1/START domain
MQIRNSRKFAFTPHRLFDAFRESAQLAKWWGPAGFTNVFHAFDFRPGGLWKFTMHGPDGKQFEIQKRFLEIVEPSLIVLEHCEPEHSFRISMRYEPDGAGTMLRWEMKFDGQSANDELREFITQANEQNFDRLSELLLRK